MKKILLAVVILFFVSVYYLFARDVSLERDVVITDNYYFSNFLNDLGKKDSLSFYIYFLLSWKEQPQPKDGFYSFDGVYSKSEVIKKFEEWPQTKEVNITILEWRWMYDIDYYLSVLWFIESWSFVDYVTDQSVIKSYEEYYTFLQNLWEDKIKSFEWFLYPDTYTIDISSWDIIRQVVINQLNNFELGIWEDRKNEFLYFSERLNNLWYNLELSVYEIITLASIIEKEENYNPNKNKIAWIFLNRLASNCQNIFRLDADISLCYGLGESYRTCTVDQIVSHLNDSSNPYNTRQNRWLTPTPIASPSSATLNAVLDFEETNDCYYLHDNSWALHTSQTLQEHNYLRSQYLN